MAEPRNDSFQPRWRHFHPQSIVWVQNPFDHTVEFKVADERDIQYTYELPANKISELPGGPIATLGIKKLVDMMVLGNKDEALRIWDQDVRAKHEAKIIMRIKEAPLMNKESLGGKIDLSVKARQEDTKEETTAIPSIKKEEAFADLKKPDIKPIINEAEDQLVEVD